VRRAGDDAVIVAVETLMRMNFDVIALMVATP
jgi:hypothetical protein